MDKADAKTNLEKLLMDLDETERQLYAYSYALSQINFAGETQDPEGCAQDRGEALAILSQLYHTTLCCEKTKKLLDDLYAYKDVLSAEKQDQIRILARNYHQASDIPAAEEADYNRLISQASHVWHKAMTTDDWDSFAPYIEKIVETLIRFAGYKDPSRKPYDVWLDIYEPGSSSEFYDEFFAQLKQTIIPLVAKIQEKGWQPSRKCIEGNFDHDTQMQLARDIAQFEGINMDELVLCESLHPFTDSVSTRHAFITTHIYPQDLMSNVLSVLHEGGHALYEMGVNPDFNYTCLAGGTSMGMHEAQSRFFENIIGRSRAFAPTLLALISKRFPDEFEDVDADQLYAAINIAQPSLIRTEADELTYCLHVIIRYEIEQDLFAGTISAKDIPEIWQEKYKHYLGIDVPDNIQGALQDTHWSGGSFGYFPTYALGSAYGAQFLAAMKKEGMDVEGLLAEGNLEPIVQWLQSRIWRFGQSKDPAELVTIATNEAFDASYFCDYLTDKFTKLYDL